MSAAALALPLGGVTCASSPASTPPIEWTTPAGGDTSARWSPADDITPQTVSRMQTAWTWHPGEAAVRSEADGTRLRPGRFEATPVMLGGTLYISTPFNHVAAIAADTGRARWNFDPDVVRFGTIGDDRYGFVHRGVSVWTGDEGKRVFLATRWWLIALDATTGQPIGTFGEKGRVDLSRGLRWDVNRLHLGNTSPPLVWRDVVIVGSSVADRLIYDRDPPGDVQAFDARSGKPLWRWEPVPAAGHADRGTWADGSAERAGHVNVWSSMSVDAPRGLVYLPVSTPSNDWYGGNRRGDNLYAESIVCLEAATGRMVWHRQLVHHGLWDYDLASPPVLATIRRGGRDVDAVFVAGKTGFLYTFDRVSGEPVWPMPERPVTASDVPGEAASPTQPHPSWPPAFATQGFSRDDVLDFTPELRRQALARIDGTRDGPLFTPPSREGTVVMPGWIGGAGWGSTALDPERRTLFIKSTNAPVLARVAADPQATYRLDPSLTTDPEGAVVLLLPGWRSWWGLWHDPARLPVIKPPYGTLTAVNIDTGDTRWQVTLGDTPALRQHPALRDLDLPPLGVVGPPGGVATRGGLVFITGGGATLYAIDAANGAVRWQMPLRRVGYSNPMTYRLHGRQYVVVATGQGDNAALRAFVLPQ